MSERKRSDEDAADLLLEIGTEELPADVVDPARLWLGEHLSQWASENALAPGLVTTYATPRRLTVLVRNLARRQPDRTEELVGPPMRAAKDKRGEWTKAALGFAKKCGVAVDELVERPGKKDEPSLAAVVEVAGKDTAELLTAAVPDLLRRLPLPKSMKWEASGFRFSRPIRWIVCLHGKEVVPVRVADVTAANRTHGHRILSGNAAVRLSSPAGYVETLRQHHVLVDPAERRQRIVDGLAGVTHAAGVTLVADEALVDEVANLLEWPEPALGTFEEKHLALPREVLVTVLRYHQRVFAVESAPGVLANRFAVVVGTRPTSMEHVLKGNARVIRARLEDARHFHEQDRKRPLADYVPKLDDVLFLKGVGSVGDRVRRMKAALGNLPLKLAGDDKAHALRAIELCKADLVTQTVFEFPELQGIVGRSYAAADGEPQPVADAVEQHYRPRSAGDGLPEGTPAAVVALLEKADAIAACHVLGMVPKGNQDPYGQRRAAIGIVRILEERALPLGWDNLVGQSVAALHEQLGALPEGRTAADVTAAATAFVTERARVIYEDRFADDLVKAVLATGCDVPTQIVGRLEALTAARADGWFDDAAAAFKRIRNISKDEPSSAYDAAGLVEPAEKDLAAAFASAAATLDAALAGHDFRQALAVLGEIRPQVDRFFDEVRVMVDDEQVRGNRLRFLRALAEAFGRIADFTLIRGA